MDFFEAQAQAKRRTSRLVFLFALAVLGTILASYAAAVIISTASGSEFPNDRGYWDSGLFAGVCGSVLLVIGLGSGFKWLQFSAGGKAVAEMVGGRRVSPGTLDLNERRLLNVVEEMAIASGVPVPAVYILDEEQGLNAFAAGLTTGDAVVAVTRGTLEKLNRDELQGVVGHEFSHILNGDMRLNVRLTAILFGILVLGLLGRGILEGVFRGRLLRGGGKSKNSGVAVAAMIGLSLLIIGYIGYFFGRLIQAAVSRQREYLADASSVQFTRNPAGIAGALKKIGGYSLGSSVESSKAAQIGHFFFAQSFSSWFGGLFATHPPLEQRIRAIDAAWDGRFTALEAPDRRAPDEEEAESEEPMAPPLIAGLAGNPPRSVSFNPKAVTDSAGTVTERHFQNAQTLLAQMPDSLRAATREQHKAQALVFAALSADSSASPQEAMLKVVRTNLGEACASEVITLHSQLSSAPADLRLPLVQLAIPALRQLDEAAAERLLATLDQACRADSTLSPMELALSKMLSRALQNARKPAQKTVFYSFQEVSGDIALVLSALGHAGNSDEAKAREALAAGVAQLKLIETQISLLSRQACSMENLSQALDRLSQASLPIKKRLLVASAHLIGADGVVTQAEAELFRAVAAALDCPMPILG